jgi:hypothetical protein
MTTVLFNKFLESNTNVCDDITTQVFSNLAAQLDNCCCQVHQVFRSCWECLLLQETPVKEDACVEVEAEWWPKNDPGYDRQDNGVR